MFDSLCMYVLFYVCVGIGYLSSKFSHAKPLLHTLYWLPVEKRIYFKVLSLCLIL